MHNATAILFVRVNNITLKFVVFIAISLQKGFTVAKKLYG